MRHVRNMIVGTAELKSKIHGLETARPWPSRRPTLPARRLRRAVVHSGTWSVMAAPAPLPWASAFSWACIAKS